MKYDVTLIMISYLKFAFVRAVVWAGAAYEEPYWRQAFRLFDLREGVYSTGVPKYTYANPHGRETVRMQGMWQIFYSSFKPIGAHESAYGRKTVSVHFLPEILQPTIVFEQAHAFPHGQQ